MWLSTVVKYLKLSLYIKKLSIFTAMEYRIPFLTQVIGMIVNNFSLLALWYIFFQKFHDIKGWTFLDNATLFSMAAVLFSVVFISARGVMDLAKNINRGELDYFLTFPKNSLWYLSVSKTEISAIGDLISGMIVYIFFIHPTPGQFLYFLGVSLLAGLILLNFIIIVQSIGFFVGNFEDGAFALFESVLGFINYPQNIFYGNLKFAMMTIIPAFFIVSLPVSLIRVFDLQILLTLFGYWLLTFIVAIKLYNLGIKRYESGSLINTRV